MANGLHKLRTLSGAGKGRRLRCILIAIAVLVGAPTPAALAQNASSQPPDGATILGTVHDSAGKLVGDASVRLEQKGVPGVVETRTDSTGVFLFSALGVGTYIVSAEKSTLRSRAAAVIASSVADKRQVDLVLEDLGTANASAPASPSLAQAMQFADEPNFTVAGVTDWTAAGGHGSDSSLRTSEALTRETLSLKPDDAPSGAASSAGEIRDAKETEIKLRAALAGAPESFEANRELGEFYLRAQRYRESIPLLQASYKIDPANRDNEHDLALALQESGDSTAAREHVRRLLAQEESADLHRMAGELDEKLGDPLAAVRHFEQAAGQGPSEQNYFEWGSELLLHRAVWQAQEVFGTGAKAYPKSARMLTALGAALFAGALYDQAALRLCDASDLNPSDLEPYIFMGKIEIAAPDPLACVERKLARFVELQPNNSLANYFYAMAIWKQQGQSINPQSLEQVEDMLTKAVTLDARCADAYLQLGVLSDSQRNYQKSIGFYTKAIQANPQLSDAHYRLGMAYDRTGAREKATQEFQLHDQIEKEQAAAVERQRREVKQFMVVVHGQPAYPPAH